MSFVLMEKSTVACTHDGKIELIAGQSKLTAQGSQVLVEGDLDGAMISGCTTVSDPNTSTVQCASVSTTLGGVASKLKVSNKGVLLEDIQGQTSGTVGGAIQAWSVQDPGQSKLSVSG